MKITCFTVIPIILGTVHSNCAWSPTIYGEDRGLGFRYKWLAGLVSRVCTARFDSKVSMAGSVSRVYPGPNTAQWTVLGNHNFGGTVDSVTQACT